MIGVWRNVLRNQGILVAKIKQSPSWIDGPESGVSTEVDQSVMPAIQVEADQDDILPQGLADTGADTSTVATADCTLRLEEGNSSSDTSDDETLSGKIVATGMNSVWKDSSLGESEST